MSFTITHNGVPVGTVELTRADASGAEQIVCGVMLPIHPVVESAQTQICQREPVISRQSAALVLRGHRHVTNFRLQ